MNKKETKKTSQQGSDSYSKHNDGGESEVYFVCPKHGRIPREEVAFICNQCGPQEMIEKDGMFLCPQCLRPGKNFQCFLCGSTEVELRVAKPSKTSKKGR